MDEAGLLDHPPQRELRDVVAFQAVMRPEEQELPADAALLGAASPDEPAWPPVAFLAATRVEVAVPAAWAAGLREVNLRGERRPEAASRVAYPDGAGACPPAVVQERLLEVPDGAVRPPQEAVEAERQRVRQLPELESVWRALPRVGGPPEEYQTRPQPLSPVRRAWRQNGYRDVH